MPESNAAGATLRLHRKSGGIDGRTWQIIVDGKPAGSIAPRESAELPLEPGHHSLRLRSSARFVSPQRQFEAADGQVITFSCRAAMIWR